MYYGTINGLQGRIVGAAGGIGGHLDVGLLEDVRDLIIQP